MTIKLIGGGADPRSTTWIGSGSIQGLPIRQAVKGRAFTTTRSVTPTSTRTAISIASLMHFIHQLGVSEEQERRWTPEEWDERFVLKPSTRVVIGVAGALLIALAAWLYFAPPMRVTWELHPGAGQEDKVATSQDDSTTLVISAFVGGLGFIIWAFNGLRILKFTGLGVELDIPSASVPKSAALADTPPAAKAPVSDQQPPPQMANLGAADAETNDDYFKGQVGENRTHTFLLRSSWLALMLLKACQVAAKSKGTLNLRELSKVTNSGYDYLVGYFIASFSADMINGVIDPGSGRARMFGVRRVLSEKIDEIIQGNLKVVPEVEELKRQQLAALDEYLAKQFP